MIGNNCGHNPESPRFFDPPKNHANRPKVLRELNKAIERYYSNVTVLPSLNAANDSERQQRSEAREACCAVAACLVHYTDLVTLRVGIPQNDGSIMGLTMDFIAEKSGLGLRRCERAIQALKAAGMITVYPIAIKLEDATYKGIAAIRTVSKKLFAALGLGKWLKHERDKAKARREKRENPKNTKALAHVQMAMDAQRNTAQKAAQPKPAERKNTMSSVSEHFKAIREALNNPK